MQAAFNFLTVMSFGLTGAMAATTVSLYVNIPSLVNHFADRVGAKFDESLEKAVDRTVPELKRFNSLFESVL